MNFHIEEEKNKIINKGDIEKRLLAHCRHLRVNNKFLLRVLLNPQMTSLSILNNKNTKDNNNNKLKEGEIQDQDLLLIFLGQEAEVKIVIQVVKEIIRRFKEAVVNINPVEMLVRK